jgi:threonine/homoserine/homoserine lactone efflux protein
MTGLHPILGAWLAGLGFGFIACIPVGPVNVTIINAGARRGFRHAFFIGLGAAAMEVLYALVSFAGFAQFFTSRWLRAVMELASFAVMLVLGLKYLLAPTAPVNVPHAVAVVERRLHPHTAFMTGFVRVLGNPATLLWWIAVAATLLAHEWVDDTWPERLACVAGIGLGALAWFTKLGYAVSLGHGKFSTRTLVLMARTSGALLLAAALVIGGRLVTRLVQERPERAAAWAPPTRAAPTPRGGAGI